MSDVYDTVTASEFADPIPFDQRKWDRGRPVHRIGMGRTLAADGTLVGLTRDEVRAMLGRPQRDADGEWWYRLGTRGHGALFPTEVRLIVQLGPAGTVRAARLAEWD